MPSKSSSPITTFLILVPLVAVPLLAVFGVPEFAPITALGRGSDHSADLDGRTDDLLSPVRNDLHNTGMENSFNAQDSVAGEELRNPFQSTDARPQTSPSQADDADSWSPPASLLKEWAPHPATSRSPVSETNSRGDRMDRSLADFSQPESRLQSDQDHFPAPRQAVSNGRSQINPSARLREKSATSPRSRPDGDPHANHKSDRQRPQTALTWQKAVKRLNGFGIRDFQLRPSEQGDEFLFTCTYRPSENPRITHLFEAEAEQPLHAVHKVLLQVESWSKKR